MVKNSGDTAFWRQELWHKIFTGSLFSTLFNSKVKEAHTREKHRQDPLNIIFKQLIGEVENVKHSFIMSGNIKTSVIEAGNDKPVILLHGSAVGAAYWIPAMKYLQTAFRGIAPDIAGFGLSDKPRTIYDRSLFTRWLDGLITGLNLPKVSLVGHSLGGAIALHYAMEYPERVERLVLVNSAALVQGRPVPGAMFSSLAENIFPNSWSLGWLSHYEMYYPQRMEKLFFDYRLATARTLKHKILMWLGFVSTAKKVTSAAISKICCPTLLLWGENDPVFSIKDAESAASKIPKGQLIKITLAKHHPLYDQPKLFNETLISFLNGCKEITSSVTE